MPTDPKPSPAAPEVVSNEIMTLVDDVLSWTLSSWSTSAGRSDYARDKLVQARMNLEKALSALARRDEPVDGVPDCYKLVPVEPTEAMLEAAIDDGESPEVAAAVWDVMLAAAPKVALAQPSTVRALPDSLIADYRRYLRMSGPIHGPYKPTELWDQATYDRLTMGAIAYVGEVSADLASHPTTADGQRNGGEGSAS